MSADKVETLSDKIAFMFTNEFCQSMATSPYINDICEGDCDYCRIHHIQLILEDLHEQLKGMTVPFDNDIRYKLDKSTFDNILKTIG